VKTEIVPAITAALGTIKKRLDQNLQLLPSHLSAIELEKITSPSLVEDWTYQKTSN